MADFTVKHLTVSDNPSPQKWIWRNRIPAEKVTMLSGDWGSGKTHSLASIATHVFEKEELPDGEVPEVMPGHIVFLTTETDEEELSSMCAAQGMKPEDIEQYIHIIDFMTDDGGNKVVFNIEKDMEALGKVLKQYKPIMLVIDPIIEFHSRRDIDAHAIRALMVHLNQICVRYRVAIIAMIHWNKDEKVGRKNRMSGSAQYGAGVKSVITVWRDDKDKNIRHFEQTKMTLGPEPIDMAFVIEKPYGFVNWVKVDAVEPAGKVNEAKDWLVKYCADEPKLISECIKESGFSERTLRRARSHLGHEILTIEMFVDGRNQAHWDLSCERNLWGAYKLLISEPETLA